MASGKNVMYGVLVVVIVLGAAAAYYYYYGSPSSSGALSNGLYSSGQTTTEMTSQTTTETAMATSTSTSTATTAMPAVTGALSVSTSPTYGNYLVDSNGMTLYYFTKDTTGSSMYPPVSACTGGCLSIWPIYYQPTVSVTGNLSSSDFTSFTRTDGSMQTAYKGMPLYYFANDKNPGDTMGQGVAGSWYVVSP